MRLLVEPVQDLHERVRSSQAAKSGCISSGVVVEENREGVALKVKCVVKKRNPKKKMLCAERKQRPATVEVNGDFLNRTAPSLLLTTAAVGWLSSTSV